MKKQTSAKPVERLFPFVLRSRILLVGRDTLWRSKSSLHFVLITHDISEQSRAQVLLNFAHYPVVQHYTSAELEQFFGLKGTKLIGFKKSGLAQSIYAELKQYRLNKPAGGGTAPSGTGQMSSTSGDAVAAKQCRDGSEETSAPSVASGSVSSHL